MTIQLITNKTPYRIENISFFEIREGSVIIPVIPRGVPGFKSTLVYKGDHNFDFKLSSDEEFDKEGGSIKILVDDLETLKVFK